MIRRLPHRLVPAAILIGAILALSACDSSFAPAVKSDPAEVSYAPPSEAEVRETLQGFFAPVYGINDGGAVFKDIAFDFGAITVGKRVRKEIKYKPTDVYPVKAPVTITVRYSNHPGVRTVKRGERSDDVFFFFKEGAQWYVRTGRS